MTSSLTRNTKSTVATLFGLSLTLANTLVLADTERSEKLEFTVETVATDLNVPWGLAALPNGDMLITERSGSIRLLLQKGELHPDPIQDVPSVATGGQGGLLDIAIHPQYQSNGWVYLSYSSNRTTGEPGKGSNTALMRAKIEDHRLVEKEVLFKALPNYSSGHHFGGRIAFDKDNHVYLSVGDRGGRDEVQSLNNYRGKIFRLNDDGRIPANNPFVNTTDAAPETWSWGHRNPQGMEQHPESGEIWSHEHGPKGGDELNRIYPGQNYGWPTVTYGRNYSGTKITNETSRPDMVSPVTYWDPSIAPCGMAIIDGDVYPQWRDNILIGSLKFQQLRRVELKEGKFVHQETLLDGVGRVRAIEQGTDGYIYIAVESGGQILKLIPKT